MITEELAEKIKTLSSIRQKNEELLSEYLSEINDKIKDVDLQGRWPQVVFAKNKHFEYVLKLIRLWVNEEDEDKIKPQTCLEIVLRNRVDGHEIDFIPDDECMKRIVDNLIPGLQKLADELRVHIETAHDAWEKLYRMVDVLRTHKEVEKVMRR